MMWQWLITPPSQVTNEAQRRQLRLLMMMSLAFIPLVLLALLLNSQADPRTLRDDPDRLIAFGGMALFVVAYLIARLTGRFVLAISIILITLILGLWLGVFPDTQTTPETDMLYFLVTAVLIASMFLGSVWVGLVSGVVALLILALPPLMGGLLPYVELIPRYLLFLLVMSTLILVGQRHRNALEHDRQREVRESEERYRLLAENITDVIITTDAHDLVNYVSPSCYSLVGYTTPQIRGRTLLDFVHPEDAVTIKKVYSALYNGESQTAGPLIYRVVHREGHFIWVEANMRAVNESGQLKYILSTIRDCTERKYTEEVLRESEAKYRVLIEQAGDAIIISDHKGDILGANERAIRMLQYTGEELAKMRLWDVIRFGEMSHAEVQSSATLMERHALRKDGTIFSVEINSKVMKDRRMLSILRDTTERLQAERQKLDLAIERERVSILQRFIGDASHDLRTPLSVMKTSLYLLKRILPQAENDPKAKEHLGILNDQIQRIEGLLRDLLTMSRLDRADAGTFDFAKSDLNTIVDGAVATIQQDLIDKKHTLTIEKTENLPQFQADQKELARSFEALLHNAITYTLEGGQIYLRTGQDERGLYVSVRDNGIGINAIDLPHIFERFFRADKARGMQGGGMGLGLAIARRVVQAHGGKILVQSKPNNGSEFVVILPLS
jgi:PAS domain S-box-containing protein